MKNKTILLDVDSVLLLWREGFIKYMEHQGCEYIDGVDDEEHYDLVKHFDNVTIDEILNHIKRFNDGHWEFGTLNPVEGSQESLNELTDMGYGFVAISSCSTNPTAIALRKANLYNVYGDVFDAVHCVDVNESKDTHLADYESTYWIEDNFKNCVDGLKYGHKCLLLSYTWNEKDNHSDITRCNDWNEITNFIKNN